MHLFDPDNSEGEIGELIFGFLASSSQQHKLVWFFLASFHDLYSERFDFAFSLNFLGSRQCGHFYKVFKSYIIKKNWKIYVKGNFNSRL